MVEFKVRLEFSDLERLAEFSLEDRLHAHRVARFNEYRDGFNWQQISNPGNFLRQSHLVVGANLQNVVQQLWLLAIEYFVQRFLSKLNFLSAFVIESFVPQVVLVL